MNFRKNPKLRINSEQKTGRLAEKTERGLKIAIQSLRRRERKSRQFKAKKQGRQDSVHFTQRLK